MKFYVIKQIIRKIINILFYHIKRLLKDTNKLIKFLITLILILMLIRSFYGY